MVLHPEGCADGMIELCEHVLLSGKKGSGTITVVRGPAVPMFLWYAKLQADIPVIRCSMCKRSLRIKGYIVKRRPGGG